MSKKITSIKQTANTLGDVTQAGGSISTTTKTQLTLKVWASVLLTTLFIAGGAALAINLGMLKGSGNPQMFPSSKE
jgi:hypothetical protein